MPEGPGPPPETGQRRAKEFWEKHAKGMIGNKPKVVEVEVKTQKHKRDKSPDPEIPEDTDGIPPEVAAFEILPDQDLVDIAEEKGVKLNKKWTRARIIQELVEKGISPE
jgi:hypothetical protein